MSEEKPVLDVSYVSGNVFALLGRARKVARRAGWSEEDIEKMTDECREKDYDHAIQTLMKHFDVEVKEMEDF